jgi:hypothetical protein
MLARIFYSWFENEVRDCVLHAIEYAFNQRFAECLLQIKLTSTGCSRMRFQASLLQLSGSFCKSRWNGRGMVDNQNKLLPHSCRGRLKSVPCDAFR